MTDVFVSFRLPFSPTSNDWREEKLLECPVARKNTVPALKSIFVQSKHSHKNVLKKNRSNRIIFLMLLQISKLYLLFEVYSTHSPPTRTKYTDECIMDEGNRKKKGKVHRDNRKFYAISRSKTSVIHDFVFSLSF